MNATDIPAQLRRRRDASRRIVAGDPWRRYDPGEPSERLVDGYRDALVHLDLLGLTAAPRIPEMRALWRRGGADRLIVTHVAKRWEMAAW